VDKSLHLLIHLQTASLCATTRSIAPSLSLDEPLCRDLILFVVICFYC
jgi:hypothetical protein